MYQCKKNAKYPLKQTQKQINDTSTTLLDHYCTFPDNIIIITARTIFLKRKLR